MPKQVKKTTVKQTVKPTRMFVYLSHDGKEMGRDVAKTPASLAKKVGVRLLKNTKQKIVHIQIKEMTPNSSKKLYSYTVKRVKLTKPNIVLRDGNIVSYEYKTVVKSASPLKKTKK